MLPPTQQFDLDQVSDEDNESSRVQQIKTMHLTTRSNTQMSMSQNLKENRKRLQCQCQPNLVSYQTCKLGFDLLASNYKVIDLQKLRVDYYKLLQQPLDDIQAKQIRKDVDRTHSQCEFFSKNSYGQIMLERILQCISKYDPKIGYVQGMNYLIAGLLFHCEEYIAFWNFVIGYEKLELRDIYLPNLPGLAKHQQLTEIILMSYDYQVYTHLVKNNIILTLFCTPLYFSLFALVIPLANYLTFYSKLVKEDWSYSYKVILAYFKVKRVEILQTEGPELFMLMTIIWYYLFKKLKEQFYKDWDDIIKYAEQLHIEKKFVNTMLGNFDQENQWFKQSK